MSEYAVFLSYKSSDRSIAEVMERELRPYAPDLRFFLAPTRVVGGEPWRDRLVREIRNCDSLFVIYTPAFQQNEDDIRTNDWLLYEAGLKSTPDAEPDPVICFHPQGQSVPKPVEHLQGVEAGRDSLRRFLHRFLRTTDITRRERPLNKNVDDSHLDQIAETLSNAFRIASMRRRYLTYRLSVTLPDTVTVNTNGDEVGIPRQAVVDGDAASLDVFDRTDACTWEELTKRRSESESRWLTDLDTAFSAVVNGERPPPSTGTFRDLRGRILKPTLYRADWSDDTLVGIRVLLTVEPAPTYFGGALFNILRLTERYKAEIFGEFLDDQLEHARRHPELLAGVLERLRSALRLVLTDDRTRRALSRDAIIRYFPEESPRAALVALRDEWQRLYDQLWQQLDEADGAATADAIIGSLAELRSNNDRTAAIVARRYWELVDAATAVDG